MNRNALIFAVCLLMTGCRVVEHEVTIEAEGGVYYYAAPNQTQNAGKELGDIAPKIPLLP